MNAFIPIKRCSYIAIPNGPSPDSEVSFIETDSAAVGPYLAANSRSETRVIAVETTDTEGNHKRASALRMFNRRRSARITMKAEWESVGRGRAKSELLKIGTHGPGST
jgi:hypothetical protein